MYCEMALTKVEERALREFAKRERENMWTLCEKEGREVHVLRAGRQHSECNFDGCCLPCFLKGEVHRFKIKPENMCVDCDEVLHDYFDHNTILTDEYPLAGISAKSVRKAIILIKLMRSEKGPYLLSEMTRAAENNSDE